MGDEFKVVRDKAGFNDAIGYLGRINKLWTLSDNARINLDFYNWFNLLLTIYIEIYPRCLKEERIYFESQYPQILNLMIYSPYVGSDERLFINPALYSSLHNYEARLRDIWHKAGLDMPDLKNEDDMESF